MAAIRKPRSQSAAAAAAGDHPRFLRPGALAHLRDARLRRARRSASRAAPPSPSSPSPSPPPPPAPVAAAGAGESGPFLPYYVPYYGRGRGRGRGETERFGDSVFSQYSSSLSSGQGRRRKTKEEESLGLEPTSRRESTSQSTSSFGSFTTYEKISAKKKNKDDEAMTPVQRSSRLRTVKSPEA